MHVHNPQTKHSPLQVHHPFIHTSLFRFTLYTPSRSTQSPTHHLDTSIPTQTHTHMHHSNISNCHTGNLCAPAHTPHSPDVSMLSTPHHAGAPTHSVHTLPPRCCPNSLFHTLRKLKRKLEFSLSTQICNQALKTYHPQITLLHTLYPNIAMLRPSPHPNASTSSTVSAHFLSHMIGIHPHLTHM